MQFQQLFLVNTLKAAQKVTTGQSSKEEKLMNVNLRFFHLENLINNWLEILGAQPHH